MNYKNVDFNSDVVAMYSKLREGMVLAFDAEYFCPVDLPVQNNEEKREENVFKAELSCYTVKSLIKRDIIVY
jgi:hypothetical protein